MGTAPVTAPATSNAGPIVMIVTFLVLALGGAAFYVLRLRGH